MPLLIAFLLIPVVEIWLFVKVGEEIGAWQTVGLVVAVAVAGAIMLRVQGFTALNRARAAMAAGEFPSKALFDGFCVLIAGFLLIIPGFLTDILGILLFIPPLRRWIGKAIWRWVSLRPDIVVQRRSGAAASNRVVEGTYYDITPDGAANQPSALEAPPKSPTPPPTS